MKALWAGVTVHLWQATLVIALVFVLARFLRRAPARLHEALWSAAARFQYWISIPATMSIRSWRKSSSAVSLAMPVVFTRVQASPQRKPRRIGRLNVPASRVWYSGESDVIDDVGDVVRLLERNAPYTPLGGWYRPDAELDVPNSPMWFQNDWVHADLQVDGSELFLHHERVAQAARDFYDAEIVLPHSVYVNLMVAIDRAGPAHTDNPRFQGRDRSNTPMWLLRVMFWSGLFDAHVIVQADESVPASWAHGIVHLLEGDRANAGYWYRRAGRDLPDEPDIDAEIAALKASLA